MRATRPRERRATEPSSPRFRRLSSPSKKNCVSSVRIIRAANALEELSKAAVVRTTRNVALDTTSCFLSYLLPGELLTGALVCKEWRLGTLSPAVYPAALRALLTELLALRVSVIVDSRCKLYSGPAVIALRQVSRAIQLAGDRGAAMLRDASTLAALGVMCGRSSVEKLCAPPSLGPSSLGAPIGVSGPLSYVLFCAHHANRRACRTRPAATRVLLRAAENAFQGAPQDARSTPVGRFISAALVELRAELGDLSQNGESWRALSSSERGRLALAECWVSRLQRAAEIVRRSAAESLTSSIVENPPVPIEPPLPLRPRRGSANDAVLRYSMLSRIRRLSLSGPPPFE